MEKLVLHPTSVAQWQALVHEAGQYTGVQLDEALECYLVYLLMRFTDRPQMAKSVMALEFLATYDQAGHEQHHQLRDVGDKCLLFAGLFPGRAAKRRVKISYFVNLGRSAYSSLATLAEKDIASLFKALGQDFIALMDILLATRELTGDAMSLMPLQAQELWADTHSQHAKKLLQQYVEGGIVCTGPETQH